MCVLVVKGKCGGIKLRLQYWEMILSYLNIPAIINHKGFCKIKARKSKRKKKKYGVGGKGRGGRVVLEMRV